MAAPLGRDSRVGDEAISLSQNIEGDFSAEARGGIEVSASDLGQIIEQYHRAVYAFVQGDPEPYKQLSSRRDDVTLANPLGPPARGWNQVEEALDRAASQVRGSEPIRSEPISEVVTAHLAYTLETERTGIKPAAPTRARQFRFALRPYFDARMVSGESAIVTPIQ